MKNSELDLHGIRHHKVPALVEEFAYKQQYRLPALILCGNSNEMIRLVKNTLIDLNCEFDDARYGLIRICSI